MFARRVTLKLKPNTAKDFTKKLESDIIPLLRQQKGFKDEITFLGKGDTDVLAISLWDRQEDADAYNTSKYSEVVKMLGTFVDGAPSVQSATVSSSTFHKIAAPAAR